MDTISDTHRSTTNDRSSNDRSFAQILAFFYQVSSFDFANVFGVTSSNLQTCFLARCCDSRSPPGFLVCVVGWGVVGWGGGVWCAVVVCVGNGGGVCVLVQGEGGDLG